MILRVLLVVCLKLKNERKKEGGENTFGRLLMMVRDILLATSPIINLQECILSGDSSTLCFRAFKQAPICAMFWAST